MKYVSTRDDDDDDDDDHKANDEGNTTTTTTKKKTFYSFEDALCLGYAPKDGGLFVPEYIPKITQSQWKEWSSLVRLANDTSVNNYNNNKNISNAGAIAYKQLAISILQLFITPEEVPTNELEWICDIAFVGGGGNKKKKNNNTNNNENEETNGNQNDIDYEYENVFDSSTPIPVIELSSHSSKSSSSSSAVQQEDQQQQQDQYKNRFFVAELFHGPTFCFKDFGLRVVVGLLSYFANKKRNQSVTLVVATTGDTGPAAVQAVQDFVEATTTKIEISTNNNNNKNKLGILVHFPKGQISQFQQHQLTTVKSPQVKIVEFEGGGDDMDGPIKNIMKSNNSSEIDDHGHQRLICGINSYNIGRPLVQMVHFIWTYLKVVEQLGIEPGDENFVLDIVLPTGAMGNLTGAYMAKQMGVPLGNLCAGVNVYDFTNTVFTTGRITIECDDSAAEIKKTLSEAINIQLPYNLERILFYLTNQNHGLVKRWYTQLERAKQEIQQQTKEKQQGGETVATVDIGEIWLQRLQEEFYSARVTDEELCETIRNVLQNHNYWIDPHTGVGFCAAQKLGYDIPDETTSSQPPPTASKSSSKNTVVIMATASPCKFQEALITALGETKWEEYMKHHFPKRGLQTIEKAQSKTETTTPILYSFDPSRTLPENQIEWEQQSRAMIQEL